jgi:amino acid transporter
MASLDQTIEKSKSAGDKPVQKLTLFALTAMVVGSMIGSGIFSLPRTFATATLTPV